MRTEASLIHHDIFRFSADHKSIKLTNDGAALNFMETSNISLRELQSNDFKYSFCWDQFLRDNRQVSHIPFVLTIQKLAENSGMVVQFDIDHMMADLQSCFLIIADFCSQVKSGCYYFEKVSTTKNRVEM